MKNVIFTDSAENKTIVTVSDNCNELYKVLNFEVAGAMTVEYHESQSTMNLGKKRKCVCCCIRLKNSNKKTNIVAIK